LESQSQLNRDQNSENIPENIREAFDSLTSSLYNLSRIDAMRTIIRKAFFFLNLKLNIIYFDFSQAMKEIPYLDFLKAT